MRARDRIPAAALTVFSGIAFGVLAMVGVVAAIVFPAMKALDPALPEFSGYAGPHWSLAAGVVAERAFFVGFWVAGVSLACCVGAAAAMIASPRSSGLPAVRLGLLLVAVGIYLTHVAWLQPRMAQAAREYRESASAGDGVAAQSAKARFDSMHPNASRLIVGATISSLALFVASAWAATSSSGSRSSQDGASPP